MDARTGIRSVCVLFFPLLCIFFHQSGKMMLCAVSICMQRIAYEEAKEQCEDDTWSSLP